MEPINLIQIFLEVLPQAKKRHRVKRLGSKIISYDPQHSDKIKMKHLIRSKMAEIGLLKPIEGPISCEVVSLHSYPKSWSHKRFKRENWKKTKPDADNIAKYYLDAMNGIVYKDDAQIVQLFAEKRYSDIPGILISIIPKEEVMTVNEHAITLKDECSIKDLSFLIKKANHMGQMNREIHSIFSKEEDDGSHIFFEVDPIKCVSERKSYG